MNMRTTRKRTTEDENKMGNMFITNICMHFATYLYVIHKMHKNINMLKK